MNDHQTEELAAILVDEYGCRALAHARERRSQHAREPCSEAFRAWNAIAIATARLLRARSRKETHAEMKMD
jgi:hypothetical protein